ncbi:MAG: discoidin domain-containing protein [Saprospiraceae bacterium]|nr:discoidin domain-containing protein [Saprospiraceae bacterium]
MFRSIVFFLFLMMVQTGFSQTLVNIAFNQPAVQSTTANDGEAMRAVDGVTDGLWGNGSVTHTENTLQPWWEVDLGSVQEIGGISLWNRTDCCKNRLNNYYLFISDDPFTSDDPVVTQGQAGVFSVLESSFPDPDHTVIINQSGRYVRVQLQGTNVLSLAEVEVWQNPDGAFQTIDFSTIDKQLTTTGGVTLTASASSGLPVTFELISGPATLAGNQITFTGETGTVVVAAQQSGDGSYGAANPVEQSFLVINPGDFQPVVEIRTPGPTYPVFMPQLGWYEISAQVSVEHPELLAITGVIINVDGVDIQASGNNGHFTALWEVSDYGPHQVKATATITGGNQGSQNRFFDVSSTGNTESVITLDKGQVFNGGPYSYTGTYELPSSVGGYSKIIGHLAITCPPGGCDPWDRIAQVSVKGRDGQWYEIIRYITPYGVECDHTIDLTRFADLLQGVVDIRMDLVTYQNGWEFSLDLEFTPGDVVFPYSRVEKLWNGTFPFGDPKNLQPLDTFHIQFSPQAQEAELFVVNTGHGWGDNNSSNAAEFYEANHVFKINDQGAFGQKLWTGCNPNPDGCTDQNGSWQFNRAGWCPGAISPGYSYNMSGWILDEKIKLSYIFDSYVDACHPNNPGCISGITCPNCKDGFNPHYVIASYLITYGLEPVQPSGIQTAIQPSGKGQLSDLGISITPNPSHGTSVLTLSKDLAGPLQIRILDLQGRTLMEQWIQDPDSGSAIPLELHGQPAGAVWVVIQNQEGTASGRWLIH